MEHTVYLYDQHGRLAVQGKYRPKFNIGDGPKSVLPELEGETWYCIPLWHSEASMALGTRYTDIGYLLTYYVPFSINPGIGLATRSGIIGGGDWEITIQPDKKFDPEFQLVNYYDDYGFLDLEGFKEKAYFTAPAANGRGQLTGNMTATTDGKTKLYSVYHYDKYGREVKRVEENILGGYDVTETSYTFTGKPLVVTHTHNAPGKNTITERYTYSYDTGDRVKEIKHSLDGKADVVLASYTYDEFGRLETKKLHGGSAQQVGYSYNLRGWLTSIESPQFSETLHYVTGEGTPCYNGNISSIEYAYAMPTEYEYRYEFSYDGLDRLTHANSIIGFNNPGKLGQYKPVPSSETFSYDKNGNLTALSRSGDELTMTLDGNHLKSVYDKNEHRSISEGIPLLWEHGGFRDYSNKDTEYVYDRNGNMTQDLNSNISNITYNSLNLPEMTTFNDGSTISNTYLVDGTKLETVRTAGGTTATTDYCGNAVYENGVLEYLLTDEGYVTPADGKYHYYLKDHLGSNRIVASEDGQAKEWNHYTASGLRPSPDTQTVAVPSYPEITDVSPEIQPYRYNGKEYDENTKWYDYGARNYDPALMRFTTMDRFAEKYYSQSPYQYAANNPIRGIEVNGDSTVVLNDDMHIAMLIQDEQGKWQYYSINGDNVYISGKFSGGRKSDDLGENKFNSPQEFMDSDYNSEGDSEDSSINGYGFQEGYIIPATKEQDNTMRNTFIDISKNEEYSLLGNNCATGVRRTLEAAGIKTYDDKEKVYHIPANPYLGEPSRDVKVKPLNPITPQAVFREIIKQNPSGRIIYKSVK